MFDSHPSNSTELLKTVLEPLLDDFTYWFGRSRTLLEQPEVKGIAPAEQASLLARVQAAQDAVHTTKVMMQATGSQAGIDTNILISWHHLVTECWQVAMRHRTAQQAQSADDTPDIASDPGA